MGVLQLQPPQALSYLSGKSSPGVYSSAKFVSIPSTLRPNCRSRITAVLSSIEEFPPNALRRKIDPEWFGGFSIGVDIGDVRTGIAISEGFVFRPLTVLQLRGEKLEQELLDIAEKKEADEFIIGLPKSWDGKENPRSNKIRSIAGRFAVRAAERGYRVYLQDEYGTSAEAINVMINAGVRKHARGKKNDSYAAAIVLERYFLESGKGIEMVLPKDLALQEKLRNGPDDSDFDF